VFILKSADGASIGIANVVTDLTDRKKVEEELLRRRDHLDKLVAERTRSLRKANAALQLEMSQREKAEAALRVSEERFRTVFQAGPDAAALTRLEDGVYLEVSDGYTAMTGRTREEVIGRSSLDINFWCDPNDRDKFTERLKKDGQFSNIEAKFRHKDGRIRTALASGKVITLQGEPYMLSVCRDIEDWIQAEIQLQRTRSILRDEP
jgi:PAS domain S-box-containing protein